MPENLYPERERARSTMRWLLMSGAAAAAGLLGLAQPASAQAAFSSRLPVVIFEMGGKTMNDHTGVGVRFSLLDGGSAAGGVNTLSDTPTLVSFVGARIRGSSSQQSPKKQFSLEFWEDDTQLPKRVGLLGLPAEDDWILSAPYWDKSFMRNSLTYFLGNQFFWCPHTRYVEVFMVQQNGAQVTESDYHGLYHFTEKIRANKDRLGLKDLTSSAENQVEPGVTGGYLIKIDRTEPSDVLLPLDHKMANVDPVVVYPKTGEMTSAQQTYIHDYLKAAGSATFEGGSGAWQSYLDAATFVDHMIMQEIGRNYDGYRLSTFYNKPFNAKLSAGPLWDFNIAYGIATKDTENWMYKYASPWYKQLMKDPIFRCVAARRWTAHRAVHLADANILNFIQTTAAYLGEAADRDLAKWPYYEDAVYESHTDDLGTWITQRTTWMDAKFANYDLSACPALAGVTQTSDLTYGTSLHVSRPVQNAQVTAGSPLEVYWTATATLTHVSVFVEPEYAPANKTLLKATTTNDGKTTVILPLTLDTGSYRITVEDAGFPVTVGDHVLIRVLRNTLPRSLNLTSPSAGATWPTGVKLDILWTAEGFVSPLRLAYVQPPGSGSSAEVVVKAATDNDGKSTWNVVAPEGAVLKPGPCELVLSDSTPGSAVEARVTITLRGSISGGDGTPTDGSLSLSTTTTAWPAAIIVLAATLRVLQELV